MNKKIYVFATFLLLTHPFTSIAQNDRAAAGRQREMQSRGNNSSGDEDCNAVIQRVCGDDAWYSALLCQKNYNNHFTEKYGTGGGCAVKMVMMHFATEPDKGLALNYPHFENISENEIRLAKDGNKLFNKSASPRWNVPKTPWNKANLKYTVADKLYGAYKVSDKEYVLFWIPPVAGTKEADHKYDFDQISCDVLCKDEAAAMAANPDGRRREIAAIVKKNFDEYDKKNTEHDEKVIADTRPTVGMKDRELERRMLPKAQAYWKDAASAHPDAGIADAKLTKIWIMDDDWTVVKDDLGRIVYRQIHAQVGVHGSNGKCYMYNFRFFEDYMGGGTYSNELKLDWKEAAARDRFWVILCENLK